MPCPWPNREEAVLSSKGRRREPRGEKERRAVDLVCTALKRRSDIECRIGSSREELFAAFHLVYEQYLRSGLMQPNRLSDADHSLPLAAEHGGPCRLGRRDRDLHHERRARRGVGFADGERLSEEVACLRLRGLSLAEVSCLADKQDPAEKSQSALFQLMPLVAQLAYRRGVDQLLIAVHPRHARFYRRFLGFDVIAEERTYGQVCGKPAVALAMDLNGLAVNHPRVHEWLFGEPFADMVLEYNPLPGHLLDEMRMVVETCFGGVPAHEREMEMVL